MRKLRTDIPIGKKKYYIHIERRCERLVLRERDYTDPYDGDDVYYVHNIRGFTVSTSDTSEWDFVLDKYPTNDTLYLVYVLYDTKNISVNANLLSHEYDCRISYLNSSETDCICLVGLEYNVEDAMAISDAIKDDYTAHRVDNTDDYKPLEIKLPISGRTETISVGSWKGTCDAMSELQVISIENLSPKINKKINKKKKK